MCLTLQGQMVARGTLERDAVVMQAKRAPRTRAKGDELEDEPEFVVCDLQCICSERHVMTLPGDAPVRAVLASTTCPSCDRRGAMTLVPALSYPPTRDPDD
jgi:hypothetical protein